MVFIRLYMIPGPRVLNRSSASQRFGSRANEFTISLEGINSFARYNFEKFRVRLSLVVNLVETPANATLQMENTFLNRNFCVRLFIFTPMSFCRTLIFLTVILSIYTIRAIAVKRRRLVSIPYHRLCRLSLPYSTHSNSGGALLGPRSKWYIVAAGTLSSRVDLNRPSGLVRVCFRVGSSLRPSLWPNES